ncbi:hypothetical protein DV736_g3227, partial [Chaetothyriales sp. CBS 134916]
MLIPTAVLDFATLAVPDTSYWAGTAAHYYINPPGVDTDRACVWGSSSDPWGNWSPYVAGANVDSSGDTFIKLGWNPIYLEPATPFRNTMPTWGVKIDCPDGNCNGLPCAIDPSQDRVNQINGGQAIGAGGGNFCVVTVPKGSTANFIVFESGGNQDDNSGQFYHCLKFLDIDMERFVIPFRTAVEFILATIILATIILATIILAPFFIHSLILVLILTIIICRVLVNSSMDSQ